MTKPQYNQGDLIRYTRLSSSPHLLVITEVFATGCPGGYLYYRVRWLGDDKRTKEVYHIGSLDDSKHFTVVARA